MATKKQAVKKVAKVTKTDTKKVPVASGKLMTLPLEKVLPTKDNQRKIDPKSADIAELAESLKASGQVVPVNVRPHPTKTGFWELRAGERRLVASKVAGLTTILAVVQDMDEAAAKRVTVIENLQRSDLKPLEESAAVADLLATGQSLREIAAQVGKSHQWVARRARLTGLIPEWRRLFADNDTPATAMELIAAFEPEEQKDWLKKMCVYELDNPREATANISDMIQSHTRELGKALFNIAAHGCPQCEKNSANKDSWFGTKDRCLNAACFEAKCLTFLEDRERALRFQYPNLVKITKESYSEDKTILDRYQYKASKSNGGDALPALIVDGAGTGTLIWIRRKHRTTGDVVEAGPKSLEQKRNELESKRWAETVNRFAKQLDTTPIAKLEPPEQVVLLAATFGTYHQIMEGQFKDLEAFNALEPGQAMEQAYDKLWWAVRHVLADRIAYLGPVTQYDWQAKSLEAQKVANLVNVTLRDIYSVVCQEKGFTEPKSWQTEQQGPGPAARQAEAKE